MFILKHDNEVIKTIQDPQRDKTTTINIISNTMEFVPMSENKDPKDYEVKLLLSVVSNKELKTHIMNGRPCLETMVYKNPFNPNSRGYFLFMYSLQQILYRQFTIPHVDCIKDTVMYPMDAYLEDNTVYIHFVLFIKEDAFDEFKNDKGLDDDNFIAKLHDLETTGSLNVLALYTLKENIITKKEN